MTKVTAGLLVDLAKRRLLSEAFELGFEKDAPYAQCNPVAQALRDADTRLALSTSRNYTFFTLVCLGGFLALAGIYTWLLPKSQLALALSVLGVMLGLGLIASWCVVKARPYLDQAFSTRGRQYDPVEDFIGRLNLFWYWIEVERIAITAIEHFLTWDKAEVSGCARQAVLNAALEVVRFQRKNKWNDASRYRHEASLRGQVEKRYDHLRRLDFVEPGGVGPYYDEAEQIVDEEERGKVEQPAGAKAMVEIL